MSREAIVKRKTCSICGAEVGLRKKCGHKVGEIYAGEMCSLRLEDVKIMGFSFVENPFDKYTMIKMADLDYDYSILEMLMETLASPFEKWDYEIIKEKLPQYKKITKYNLCPCGSGKKYVDCCQLTGKDMFDHYHITFLERKDGLIKPLKMVGTWKK